MNDLYLTKYGNMCKRHHCYHSMHSDVVRYQSKTKIVVTTKKFAGETQTHSYTNRPIAI